MAKSAVAAPKSGLTWKHKIGYGLGDFGGCMTFALMGSYVTRYYVNVLKVDTVILATLQLIWNVWDAVNDPMMGALMDKLYAKKAHPQGKFRPWLLRATPMLAITSIIFWTVPTFFEGTAMICVLVPGIFVIGSWAAFKFVWNITDDIRAKMAAHFEAK